MKSSKLGPIAGILAMATIGGSVILGPGDERSLRILGACIGFVALPFAFIPILHLARRGKPKEGESYLHTTTLVDTGLFSIVRHPQYLSYILFMFTFGLLAQHPVIAVLAVLASTLMYWNAALEEGECLKKLGLPYQEYMEKVPRFNVLLGIARRYGKANG